MASRPSVKSRLPEITCEASSTFSSPVMSPGPLPSRSLSSAVPMLTSWMSFVCLILPDELGRLAEYGRRLPGVVGRVASFLLLLLLEAGRCLSLRRPVVGLDDCLDEALDDDSDSITKVMELLCASSIWGCPGWRRRELAESTASNHTANDCIQHFNRHQIAGDF